MSTKWRFLAQVVAPMLNLSPEDLQSEDLRKTVLKMSLSTPPSFPSARDYLNAMLPVIIHGALKWIDEREKCLGPSEVIPLKTVAPLKKSGPFCVLHCPVESVADAIRQDLILGFIGSIAVVLVASKANETILCLIHKRHAKYCQLLNRGREFYIQILCKITTHYRQFEAVVNLERSAIADIVIRPTRGSLCLYLDDLEQESDRMLILREHLASCDPAQRKALSSAVGMIRMDRNPRLALIHGPPGTGKTRLIVRLVESLFLPRQRPAGAALICVHSNAALNQLALYFKNSQNARLMYYIYPKLVSLGPAKKIADFLPTGSFQEKKKSILSANVIMTTLNYCRSEQLKFLQSMQFCCLVIDDADRRVEPDVLIPMVRFGAQKVIVLSDQPRRTSQANANEYRSFPQRFEERLRNQLLGVKLSGTIPLDVQYRLHPEIFRFPQSLVHDDRISIQDSPQARSESPFEPYLVFDLQNSEEVVLRPVECRLFSFINVEEARFVSFLCSCLWFEKNVSVGVVSPFTAQKNRLRTFLRRTTFLDAVVEEDEEEEEEEEEEDEEEEDEEEEDEEEEDEEEEDEVEEDEVEDYEVEDDETKAVKAHESLRHFNKNSISVEVGKMESFQGAEKDVIIVSGVRATNRDILMLSTMRLPTEDIGDAQGLFVALTRAKEAVYVVGHRTTLSANEDWRRLYDDAEKRGRLVTINAGWTPEQISQWIKKRRS